jgi:o-succinylbenzoate synthase
MGGAAAEDLSAGYGQPLLHGASPVTRDRLAGREARGVQTYAGLQAPTRILTMRVEAIDLRVVELRLREPFRISSGVTHTRAALLVTIDLGGVDGIAECVAGEAPSYSYETMMTARLMIQGHLGPALLGQSFGHPLEVAPFLDRVARGHRMAKAGLEMAVWEGYARGRGESLATVLGGTKAAVPAGVSIGIQPDVETLIDRIRGFLAQHYRRIKLKIEPGRDMETLRAVRSAFPDIPLTVDANAAYGRADMDLLASLDQFDLMLVEQPFPEDALLLHARLQAAVKTDICLDESITTPERCREAIELRAGRVINIKPGRLGGHGPALDVHDQCAEAGMPVWCGGMLETGIGRAHNVALASLPNMRLPNDTSASERYWERDVVIPPFQLDPDGMVEVPAGPGLGVEIDHDFLRAIQVDRLAVKK